MGKICEVCGKRPHVGHNVSHANNKTKRRWLPNLKRVKTVHGTGTRHMIVCTRCLRSGTVVKAI